MITLLAMLLLSLIVVVELVAMTSDRDGNPVIQGAMSADVTGGKTVLVVAIQTLASALYRGSRN
jgi:hypothetical protein